MGIAIDFVTDSTPSSPKQTAVLIPELAFLIQQHLIPRDLAIASRVCKNWQEAWTPFLYYHVRYQHQLVLYTNSSLKGHSRSQSFSDSIYSQQQQQQYNHHHVLPFLNLNKYAHWIKSLDASNLVVSHLQYPCSLNVPSSPSSPSGSLLPVQDHLHQIQSCTSLNLTQLSIFKTVMSLERLDELLSALPMLKVFKFEVVNKVESSAKTGSASVSGHSRSGSYSGSSLSRGYIQQHQSNLILMKPKRISLEGLEQEVVRVIARRLYRNLERLELSFTASGVVVQSAIEELFAHCGSVLKSLSLTRVEICQVNYNREWSTSIQAEVAALLSSLEAFSLSQSPPSSPGSSRSTVFPPALSSSGTMSTSTSSSSFSSSFSRTSSTSSSASSVSDQPKTTSVLESLSFSSCSVSDRECAIILKQVPALKELYIHDCKNLSRRLIPSILTNTPLLESISINSVPYIHPEGLIELFTVSQQEKSSEIHSAGVATSNNLTSDPSSPGVVGLRLKHVQLSYLRQLDDNVMKVLARHQGSNLVKLSLQWCPHVTDEGIIPILKSCEKLKDISIYLSKPTLNIFQELTDSNTGTKIPWACAQTLERLEVCGQMFLDRIRASNEHLQPQLYHHTSPNPHHIRNGSIGRAAASTMAISGNTSIGTHTSNIIHDPYTVAHDQGYPMYRLLRYNTFSNPFRELQAQMETFPRLTHLGIPSKGVEHLIRKGFGPKVHLRSLALLNQQGRAWSLEEVEDLLRHMPELRILVCEKNTILGPPQPAHNRKEANLYSQHEVLKLLQQKNVELLQPSSSTGSNLCASLK